MGDPVRIRVGSSPLARGLRHVGVILDIEDRIIPARAGFTAPRRYSCSSTRDHPRSRGVYGRGRIRRRPGPGSSPLARGLQPQNPLDPERNMIIPARAGFTRDADDGYRHREDHPRSRGVYSTAISPARSIRGSSPLARGLHHLDFTIVHPYRIIPARAGFTQRVSWP